MRIVYPNPEIYKACVKMASDSAKKKMWLRIAQLPFFLLKRVLSNKKPHCLINQGKHVKILIMRDTKLNLTL